MLSPPRYDNQQTASNNRKPKQMKISFKNFASLEPQLHSLGQQQKKQEQPLDELVLQDIKAIMNTTILKSKKTYSKEYIPLGSIVDNSVLKQHQLKKLHFQHIYLSSINQNSLHKVVFKHNQQTKQIRFYIPTFLRFSLIKLHSEDLKNITHIQNKNNLIIYINVYSKGLPKMLIEKLTKKTKVKDKDHDREKEEQAKLLFRANRHLYEAKYYTSYNDYLIFMFNPFSQKMIEFEIMKNVMFAPFEEAELILHIRINKKIFKLERSKTLKIAKSVPQGSSISQQQSPKPFSSAKKATSIRQLQEENDNSINLDEIQQQSSQKIQQEEFDLLEFNKIIMQFKLQKPKQITDSFRFHKSIQFGNYGIMTNQINIHIGTYESPEKKKQLQEQRQELNLDEQDLHEAQLQDISSLRLSIGLYKHPVTQLCTFFIPLMLAGGLTLLLFHLCDHNLTNELQVLAIILVAYGAFIPQFRDRISMSRTVICVDFYIVYNMIPAILCALQSINESRHKKTYNSYQIISVIMYYISVLFLIQIYLVYLYIDGIYFKKYTKEMVHNFDTEIFQNQNFEQDEEMCLSWFVLAGKRERAFFCQKQQPKDGKRNSRPHFTRKQTLFSSKLQQTIQKDKQLQELAESMALQIRMSATTNKTLRQVKEQQEEEQENPREQHEYLYRTKVIENQRHIHSFQKILDKKHIIIGISIIFLILGFTLFLSRKKISEMMSFQDLNKNCIHDDEEEQRLARVESIINREQKLGRIIGQNWNNAAAIDPSTPIAEEDGYDFVLFGHHKLHQQSAQNLKDKTGAQTKKDGLQQQQKVQLRHHFNSN